MFVSVCIPMGLRCFRWMYDILSGPDEASGSVEGDPT